MANKKAPAKKASGKKAKASNTMEQVNPSHSLVTDVGTIDSIRLKCLQKYGSNAVVKGSDMSKMNYGRISTGSIGLDMKLGGGIPLGRIIQIAGAKSSVKTTLSDHIAKSAQGKTVEWVWTERKYDKGREAVAEFAKKVTGLVVAYLDVEGTQDEEWLARIGVDTNKWLYMRPSGLEEALNMAHDLQLNGVHVIFIDSIDALEPTLYYETEAGDSAMMGVKQKQLGEYVRKVTATNNKLSRGGQLPCTVVFLNQLREKIGAYGDWFKTTIYTYKLLVRNLIPMYN